MGADIHMRVEFRREETGAWTDGDHYRRNPWYEEDRREKKFEVIGLLEDRNYFLFALLADVRNHNNMIEPICHPKGVPADCCESVARDIIRWGCDGHSHSYFTLKELLDWHKSHEQVFEITGVVSPEAAEKLDTTGEVPITWCSWTSQKGWVERSWKWKKDVLKPLIKRLSDRAKDLFYLQEDYDFEEDKMEIASNIRIVFWFDN